MSKKKKRPQKQVGATNEKKENFIIRRSSQDADLEMLEPFIEDYENADRFHWVVKTMQSLRKSATVNEIIVAKYLWVKRIIFIAQAPFRIEVPGEGVHCYFADFYIPALKLVIEIDGKQHRMAEGLVYDKYRDEAFEYIGIKTLRISNEDVREGEHETIIPMPPEEALRKEKIFYAPEGMSLMTREARIAKVKRVLGYEK